MFEAVRYITKGISSDLSIELITYLWNLIDELKGNIELDYLEVFHLKVNHVKMISLKSQLRIRKRYQNIERNISFTVTNSLKERSL